MLVPSSVGFAVTLSVCWGVRIDFTLTVLSIPLLSSAEAKEL